MKKIFLFIQLVALSSALPAFAITGGPFDNGSYSILDERNGFYEAAYSFTNGSGYSQWTADNYQGVVNTGTPVPNYGDGSLLTANGSVKNANRTVMYFKGVTYFGSAMGEIDTTARTIQGFGNAFSDYGVAVTTQQTNNSFFNSATSSAASSTTVVASGRNYSLSLNWTGKITATSPQLRFSGSGELSVIAPNGNETIAGLAYTGYQGLIASINESVSKVGQAAQTTFNPAVYTQGSAAISGILNGTTSTPASSTVTPTYAQAVGANGVTPVDVNGDGIFNNDLVQSGQTVVNTAAVAGQPGISTYLTGTGPDNSYDQSTVEKIKVTGYRRYF